MKFKLAAQLKCYLTRGCKGDCTQCGWHHREGDCMLLARVMQHDYKWIPTAERLPGKAEEGKLMLITITAGDLRQVRQGTYYSHKGIDPMWTIYGYGTKLPPEGAEAWQLAPEPYRKEED